MTCAVSDEDLRTNRQVSRAKQEWESSKAKQMPRIPKRKAKGQYRKRDETSPSLDSVATDAVGSQDTLTLPDEVTSATSDLLLLIMSYIIICQEFGILIPRQDLVLKRNSE